MAKKDKVRKALAEVGAAFAVRSDRFTDPSDPYGAQMRGEKRYHIHPDASRPEVTAMLRFRTLDEILAWAAAAAEAKAVWDECWAKRSDDGEYTDADEAREYDAAVLADEIMSNFWASLED